MANFKKTYRFVRVAFSIGVEDAVTAGMIAATFWNPDGVRVGRVRTRLTGCGNQPWIPKLRRVLRGMDDDDHLGRFRTLHTQWSADRLLPRKEWVSALKKLAKAKDVRQAVDVATRMESNLQGHGGQTGYLLGQLMHLLHPKWFAVVNGENEGFWRTLGYNVGGVANLVTISADYRRAVREHDTEFNVIDQVIAIPFVRVLLRRGGG